MKNLLKFPMLLLALFLGAVSFSGCVATAQPGVVVGVGAPPPVYYGRPYPPRAYYRPRPFYRPRPARVVVVEPRRSAPRPYYNSYNVRPHRAYRVR